MQNARLDEAQAGIKIAGRNIINLRYTEDTNLMAENEREFQKNIYLCFTDYAKAFDCVDHKTVENSSRDGNTSHLPASWEICMQVKKQQLELDVEQQTGSK